jgi:protein transport protein SEC24
MADRKKRDRYAGAAYEFGANAAGTVPRPGEAEQQPAQYGAPPPAQYGMPAQQGYPVPGAQAVPMSPQHDPNTLGQQFQQMNLGPQPVQVAPQAQQQAAPAVQNQLYPSDLVAQPVHAAEIDQAPPPINLPANLAVTPSPHSNCPPPYIRSTLTCVPTTHSLLKKSKLPFALIVQPYTSLHDDEAPVPVIDDQVISRCRRCRAYINPYVVFLDHGHRWRCNMCNLTNDVPQVCICPPLWLLLLRADLL